MVVIYCDKCGFGIPVNRVGPRDVLGGDEMASNRSGFENVVVRELHMLAAR